MYVTRNSLIPRHVFTLKKNQGESASAVCGVHAGTQVGGCSNYYDFGIEIL